MVIGITGGIGSGKSEVTRYLRSLGEKVICADEVSRQVVEPGEPGAEAIKQAFGQDFFNTDGTLNRSMLASHVFDDKILMKKLNDTLHPIIIKRVNDMALENAGRVFLDVALLIQSGMHKTVDYVWLVKASLETRIKRVKKRDNTDKQSVLRRINNQLSDTEMSNYADEIIENNSSLTELHKRINELLGSLKEEETDEQKKYFK